MNLHLVEDEKFINGAINLFEKYNLHNNIFIIGKQQENLKYVVKRHEVVLLEFSKVRIVREINLIVEKYKVEKIFIHYLTPFKAFICNRLKSKYSLKTYWIFYGADLYSLLNREYNYSLYDETIQERNHLIKDKIAFLFTNAKRFLQNRSTDKKELHNFVESLSYFCFWNTYDFQLFIKYYRTQAQLLNFAYFNVLDYSPQEIGDKEQLNILINNSASVYGNHLTILRKIFELGNFDPINKIITPLSYGNESIKKEVCEYGTQKFNEKFMPLSDFLPEASYYELLDSITIAFFGAKRQEAAGNIFYLLKKGVKVFLRKDNNMLRFLREKGFIVFNFEEDFSNISDLKPLSLAEMQKNQESFHSLFNLEVEANSMKQLIS